MDAKPQRPRALKVHDENMPPPTIISGNAPGKTLHQRTRSTPAFGSLLQEGAVKAANKKVLGEVNANIRLIRDDSEVGKASPGKIVMHEPVKPAPAAFARPATRPLAPKNSSSQNTVQTTTQGAVKPELVKKIVAKKSTKVLKEVQPEAEIKKPVSTAPLHQTLVAPAPAPVIIEKPAAVAQRPEIRKTETVPLRDEPAARAPVKAATVGMQPMLPMGFASQLEYVNFVAAQNAAQMQYQPAMNGMHAANAHVQYQPMDLQPGEQFYDFDEDGYYYEEGYTTARSFGLRGESTGGVTTVLAPKQTEKTQIEIDEAKIFVETTRTAEDIEDEQWDTSMVAEYGEEIFGYMRELENRMSPNPRYMDQQTEIQWSMRAVLMDWVVQVHQRFNLLPETLFLTVNYIDRFLSCKIVSLGKLQLVGATAIFVAAKYEEVQCPTIGEIIYMVDGGYNGDELLKAERFMLSMLQFELGWPGPMSFLRRISKADDYDLETRTLGKYFLEVTVMDERFVGCTPSFLAAGAHCMARLMLRKGDWSQAHVFYSNYTYAQLKQLLAAILECCEEPQRHHAAVFEKYMDKRYKRASTFVAGEISRGFSLPGVLRGGSMGTLDSTGGRCW
ncbi:B-type cyclin [Friedmanniomyces endolithicus]|uniref:B-type cyclin n=1 Tax=Friedmanniomyces endolithicus TaxID=329885 RepID=A0A4U0U0U2_9PEZI|nr:B-type cyclin [Friedmanniomyces endolithicus]KAK0356401.1 B-type cyclin [Friedmanniomyces endolithicus]KAK0780401.1 B-type cyclin [Friedmanniomyces endolithicus]KAK0792275.1 B-type cyclin [Friedmanniomyces endolithicus]KAK0804488.1 B-type cyclin [Friedmanniomyces endolithicus]